MKDWVCAGAALAGVALLELQGLTAPVASDAVAALQPVFFGISYLRIAEAGRKYPSDDDALDAPVTRASEILAQNGFAPVARTRVGEWAVMTAHRHGRDEDDDEGDGGDDER